MLVYGPVSFLRELITHSGTLSPSICFDVNGAQLKSLPELVQPEFL